MIVGLGVLGFWLYRVQGERMSLLRQETQGARDDLDDQRKDCADEIDRERRHTEQLREQHSAAEELLRRQLDDLQRTAGIDAHGLVTAGRIELPSDVKANILETLSLVREMAATREAGLATALAPSPEDILKQQVSEANSLFAAGKYEEAAELYSRASQVDPGNVDALPNLGAALFRMARYQEALDVISRALEQRPDDPASLTNLGTILVALGRPDEALDALTRAVAIEPDSPAALNGRGAALLELGRFEEATRDLSRSLSLSPGDALALNNLGACLDRLGEPVAARAKYNEAVDLAPEEALFRLNRASLEARSRDVQAAERDLDWILGHNDSLRSFRKRYAARAGSHSYFQPLRDSRRLARKFRAIVGENEPTPAEAAPTGPDGAA
ncbi:MAG: tetratricopeptide repeat protein [Dehalococcoidia bacterium]